MTRAAILLAAAAAAGCGWQPAGPTPPPRAAVEHQFAANAGVPSSHLQHVVVLVQLPAYGTLDQLRAGNMGHAAIEFGGQLHDMGSLNGYAFTFRPSTAVRCWPCATADETVAHLVGHPDADGWLDSLTRFDVTVTADQADKLGQWWAAVEARMADPHNTLYHWSNLQCSSCVAISLRAAGITADAPLSPSDLDGYLRHHLRDTAGPTAGRSATVTMVQAAAGPTTRRSVGRTAGLLLRWPALLAAGRRTPVTISTPDGGPPQPILWSDGPAYAERAATFAVPPAEAVRRAGVAAAQPLPDFAVGRWYHVATAHVIGQAAVGGPYVNGDTGVVVMVNDARVIRFDLFDGDRLVNGGR